MLGGSGVAAGEMEVLLEVDGRFDVDRGVEMAMIQAHINVQKCCEDKLIRLHKDLSGW